MAQRVGVSPAQYKQLLSGTHLISVAEAKKVLVKAEGLGSLYGSTQVADDFNLHNAVYKQPQKVDGYIEPSLTLAQP
jgi:NitT/TauT family transport system substrate-binding protein